ncbi:MAG: glycosyltransferase family 4 protein [Ignavibacteriales bacterium]|nr:glycosyltransferase family 4 protein [Ignavibacteriales bacterium]
MNLESEEIKIIFAGRYNSGEILSGPEKVAKRIFTCLYDKTDSVFIEYFFDGSKYSIWKKLFGKEIIIDSQNNRVFRLGITQILLFTIKFKPKIVHILSFERFTLTFFMLKFILRYKISYTINGIVAFENSKFRRNTIPILKIKDKIAEWCLIKFSNKLFFLSEQSVNIARKYYNFVNVKIILITNGVDKIFNQVFIERQYEEKSKLNVVLVADLTRVEKGLDFFLKAIQPVQNDFIFSIIGENLNSYDQIKYYPKMPTDKFAKFLLNQDIFISSSIYDPFPIATIEAMAAGVILILTDENGVSRFIVNGENGFVYSYGDDEALRNYLLELKMNSHLRKKLSQNAATIYNQFRWEDISKEYLEKFYRMISE